MTIYEETDAKLFTHVTGCTKLHVIGSLHVDLTTYYATLICLKK